MNVAFGKTSLRLIESDGKIQFLGSTFLIFIQVNPVSLKMFTGVKGVQDKNDIV